VAWNEDGNKLVSVSSNKVLVIDFDLNTKTFANLKESTFTGGLNYYGIQNLK
jgi:predicted Ser/Thr protein kinase